MIVLAIGGLDPSGGAGILQDARTIEDLGGWAMGVATAWTVQSSRGVEAWEALPAEVVARQARAILDDFAVAAVKVGMVGTPANADAIAGTLEDCRLPVVFDPVLAATRGGALADPSLPEALRRLLPHVAVVTPNLDETEAVLGRGVRDPGTMAVAARDLLGLGARAALVKGGHLSGDPRDVLADADGVIELGSGRIGDGPFHGTGCVLASALAFFLASGLPVRRAAALARDYMVRRLGRAARLAARPLAYV